MLRVATVLFAPLLLLLPAAALATPWVHVAVDPALPAHVENPGGQMTATCTVYSSGYDGGTLRILVLDPSGAVLHSEDHPGDIYHTFAWIVPAEMPDGIYTYRAEYWPSAGDMVSAEAPFLVAGLTTGICAYKYIDWNENGSYDSDVDSLASGWEICTSGIGCQTTGDDFVVCWFFIPPGTYEVCETLQPGYMPTTPACQTVTVGSGDIVKVEFGNIPVGACCFHPGGACEILSPLGCLEAGGAYQGDFSLCEPGLCPPTATTDGTWGGVKSLYR